MQLKAHGLVESRRGRAGGYLLVADPATISVSQVLRIVDGPIAPLTCISRTAYSRCKDCPDEMECAVRRLFAETYAATLARMETTTLAVALADEPTVGSPAHHAAVRSSSPTQCERRWIAFSQENVSTQPGATIEGLRLLMPMKSVEIILLQQPGIPT